MQYAADVNCQQYCGTSPLHQAASEGLVDIVRHLVENNAKLRIMEEYHISPVFSAAQYGQAACLKILLDRDKDTAACKWHIIPQTPAQGQFSADLQNVFPLKQSFG